MRRKLAAVLSADVVGYSKLMEADAAGALSALRAFRGEIFEPAVNAGEGRIVKSLGDGWLVEFESASEAMSAAVAIHRSLEDRDAIRLRIGIHLGDIAHVDDDIYGDGVNIASRLQAMAPPNGLIVSSAIFDSLDETQRALLRDGGERRLKNISRPVRVWMLDAQAADGGEFLSGAGARSAAGFPTIWVEPFMHSGQGAFASDLAQALGDRLLAALIEIEWAAVLRGSGVGYQLTGDVRSRGGAVRIDVSLSAPDGAPLWRDRFDEQADASFEWEDDVARTISAEAFGLILDEERSNLSDPDASSSTPQEMLRRALIDFYEVSEPSVDEALQTMAAIDGLAPDFPLARHHARRFAGIGLALGMGGAIDRHDAFLETVFHDQARIGGDALAQGFWRRRRSGEDQTLAAALDAVISAPNADATTLFLAGWAAVHLGAPDRAIDVFRRFRSSGRFSPLKQASQTGIAMAWIMAGQDLAAVENAADAIGSGADLAASCLALAAASASLRRTDDAAAAIAAARRIDANLDAARFISIAPNAASQRLASAFKLAGL